jgi:hypothetical protein
MFNLFNLNEQIAGNLHGRLHFLYHSPKAAFLLKPGWDPDADHFFTFDDAVPGTFHAFIRDDLSFSTTLRDKVEVVCI